MYSPKSVQNYWSIISKGKAYNHRMHTLSGEVFETDWFYLLSLTIGFYKNDLSFLFLPIGFDY